MANEAPDPTKIADALRSLQAEIQRLIDASPHEITYATAAEHLEAAIMQLDPSSANPD